MTLDHLRTLIGQEVGISDWHVITQQQIDRFAEITGDRQWIHTDPARARLESPYGTTIAHGFLTVSMLSTLINEAVPMEGEYKLRVNYGFNRLRFTGAVPANARIRGRFTLHSMKDVDGGAGGVELTWIATVEVEGREKPALVAEWLGRTYY